jgi:hypothetical protein
MVPLLRAYPKQSEKGQAAAELAVIMPLFVLFIIGIMWAAQFFYSYLSAITAASDCAMLGAQQQASGLTWFGGFAIEHVEHAYGVTFRIKAQRDMVPVEECAVYVDETAVNHAGYPLDLKVQPRYTFRVPFQRYSSYWPNP